MQKIQNNFPFHLPGVSNAVRTCRWVDALHAFQKWRYNVATVNLRYHLPFLTNPLKKNKKIYVFHESRHQQNRKGQNLYEVSVTHHTGELCRTRPRTNSDPTMRQHAADLHKHRMTSFAKANVKPELLGKHQNHPNTGPPLMNRTGEVLDERVEPVGQLSAVPGAAEVSRTEVEAGHGRGRNGLALLDALRAGVRPQPQLALYYLGRDGRRASPVQGERKRIPTNRRGTGNSLILGGGGRGSVGMTLWRKPYFGEKSV